MPRSKNRRLDDFDSSDGGDGGGGSSKRQCHQYRRGAGGIEGVDDTGSDGEGLTEPEIDMDVLEVHDASLDVLPDRSFGADISRHWHGDTLRLWTETCTIFFSGSHMCAWCGKVHIQANKEFIRTISHFGAIPYSRENPIMTDLCERSMYRGPKKWNVCKKCLLLCVDDTTSSKRNVMSEEYVLDILNCPVQELSLLSILDIGYCWQKKVSGFCKGSMRLDSLFNGPLIAWSEVLERTYFAEHKNKYFTKVLDLNLKHNPLLKCYKTMSEIVSPTRRVPYITSECVINILKVHQFHSPVFVDNAPTLLPSFYSTSVDAVSHVTQPSTTFDLGLLHHRDPIVSPTTRVTAASSMEIPTIVSPFPDGKLVTVEYAVFPYLFPDGIGYFSPVPKKQQDSETFNEYLEKKCSQLFSVFTLFKPYLLLMYHLRQSMVLKRLCSDTVLEKDVKAFLKKHPTANQEDCAKHSAKNSVPVSFPGSSKWHRKELRNLLYKVHVWGMPTFFLTLTMDENSPTRFEEVVDLEFLLKKFMTNVEMKWGDAPVEMTVMFHKRNSNFMDVVVKGSDVLGRCQHWLVRYEAQGRGSLHAHILLWVHPDDIEKIENQIVAMIPGSIVGNEMKRPTDEAAAKLYDYVVHKQLHTCNPEGCMKKMIGDKCKYGFPGTFPCLQNGFNSSSGRYEYLRPLKCDRNVVPYHPTVLLLWGGHCNIQRVYAAAWSKYVLKYALKAEPTGHL